VVSYPEYPAAQLLFDVDVEAVENEWRTRIYVAGRYDGPADVIAHDSYTVEWMLDERKLLESGTATLELASGKRLLQSWSSVITPSSRSDVVERFPAGGELIRASISPFEVDGQVMSYRWEGTVSPSATPKEPRS
jgi:hypothetical protein